MNKGNFYDDWGVGKSLLVMIPIFAVIIFLTLGTSNTMCEVKYSPEWYCWQTPLWLTITSPIILFSLYGLAIWRLVNK